MPDILWLIKRLKAMSIPEIFWRTSQVIIHKREENKYCPLKTNVTAYLFNPALEKLILQPSRLALNITNINFSLETSIPLLGEFDYERYKWQWKAGFQTENNWPDEFSYFLKYKQRDDIGDARTNWELNRHFQFALLAKNYAASGDKKYLIEFEKLFEDWNDKNPFLWGISWTSVMEIAIRASNWCYTYCFLSSTDVPDRLLEQLRVGIINMTDYIVHHYSRYSSANNHLIVEAYAIGQSGILFQHEYWISLGISLLTRELPIQNYSDGINKEQSLHYQSFYMEAMGLMLRLMIKNGIIAPEDWTILLDKMACYVATCIGNYGEVIEFGDNDEGKILDLQGSINYYQYVLGMYSILLNKQYIDMKNTDCETLNWIFTEEELNKSKIKPQFLPDQFSCYKEGGNSILRSKDRRIIIGIDHAAIGYGKIAAHGHADALSFQIFVAGHPLFVDPGTYIYHCDLLSRNAYRKTQNHNTVSISEKDQSEMLGAFLWGRKAKCELLGLNKENNTVILWAKHDGYQSVIHTREFIFDGENKLLIFDSFDEAGDKTVNFIFPPNAMIIMTDLMASIQTDIVKASIDIKCEDTKASLVMRKTMYSPAYGKQEETNALCINTQGRWVITIISIMEHINTLDI